MSRSPTLVLGVSPPPKLVLGNPETQSTELLYVLRQMVARHPEAVRLIGRALLAEGERFRASEEGRAVAARIAESPAFGRLRSVWESLAMSLPDGAQLNVTPSDALELFARFPHRDGSFGGLDSELAKLVFPEDP
jgi:hypothetical protein